MSHNINEANAVLKITVNNHAGVLSHICGLFARRAYNIDSLLAIPEGDGRVSEVLVMVRDNGNLEQVIRQTQKLVDVLDVKRCDDLVLMFRGLNAQLATQLTDSA